MNLRWITLFATVAEEGSFTRAATRLNIAQPWLSAQIRKLEYELGIELLLRDNVGVRVTEAGAQLLPHAAQLSESARLFKEVAWSLGEHRSRALKLGCYLPLIDMPSMKGITLDFQQGYTNFELTTVADYPKALLKALEECQLDLVIVPGEAVDGLEHLEKLPIGQSGVYILSPKGTRVTSLRDLADGYVGIPPEERAPKLVRALMEKLGAEGIRTTEIPEFDRRAIEHSVISREDRVALALDDQVVRNLPAEIQVLPVDGLWVEHLLCRTVGRDLGRAAERFWAISEREVVAEKGGASSMTP